ncbi:energy transducer TonB [Oxalobacteraceae bacterium A2-2]
MLAASAADEVQTKAKTVSLALLVGANGEVQDARLTRSSGLQELDQATLDAFRRCTFHATLFRGQPQLPWVMLSYRWELPKD